jgi:hypothetical protein
MMAVLVFVVHVEKDAVLLHDEYFAAQTQQGIQLLRRELAEMPDGPGCHFIEIA